MSLRWEKQDGDCTVCRARGFVRYVDLYTIGSEGTWLCQPCQNKVNAFIREMITAEGSKRRDAILAAKRAKAQVLGGSEC